MNGGKEGLSVTSMPLYVKEDCLLCHGSKEEELKFIQEKYDIGYDYKNWRFTRRN